MILAHYSEDILNMTSVPLRGPDHDLGTLERHDEDVPC